MLSPALFLTLSLLLTAVTSSARYGTGFGIATRSTPPSDADPACNYAKLILDPTLKTVKCWWGEGYTYDAFVKEYDNMVAEPTLIFIVGCRQI